MPVPDPYGQFLDLLIRNGVAARGLSHASDFDMVVRGFEKLLREEASHPHPDDVEEHVVQHDPSLAQVAHDIALVYRTLHKSPRR